MHEAAVHLEVADEAAAPRPGLPGLYCELTKIRLSGLVVFTTAVGFVMASPFGVNWGTLGWTLLGTMLSASAAAALNQVVEQTRDGRMHRTLSRPLPAGHLSTTHTFVVGLLLAYAGTCVLAFGANPASAGIGLSTILLYVLVYTPLKAKTSLNTIIGAVVGALPPVLGWIAASGVMASGAWLLAAILFTWQLPHFLALAWMYRDDYRRGGFRMLPVLDTTGELTGRVCVIASLALCPLALAMTMIGIEGMLFGIVGCGLGLWMTYRSVKLWRSRNTQAAKQLFLASITYLPLLLIVMLFDRQTVEWIDTASLLP